MFRLLFRLLQRLFQFSWTCDWPCRRLDRGRIGFRLAGLLLALELVVPGSIGTLLRATCPNHVTRSRVTIDIEDSHPTPLEVGRDLDRAATTVGCAHEGQEGAVAVLASLG